VTTATETSLPTLPDVEAVFQAFVRNANAIGQQARTARGEPKSRLYEASSELPLSTDEVLATAPVLMHGPPVMVVGEERSYEHDLDAEERESLPPPMPRMEELPSRPPPGSVTQRIETEALVPDVRSIEPPPPPPRERAEDGQVPPRELERLMGDMAVLLRYGHDVEVAERLEKLVREYPEDLLLLRRIAEFHLETKSAELAKDVLFKLASGLFERRNVHGMRVALEQVLVLEPDNPRAHKLLSLLERRESERPPS